MILRAGCRTRKYRLPSDQITQKTFKLGNQTDSKSQGDTYTQDAFNYSAEEFKTTDMGKVLYAEEIKITD